MTTDESSAEKKLVSRLAKMKKVLPTSSGSGTNLHKPPANQLPPSALKNPARLAQKPNDRHVDFYTKKKTKKIPNVASMSDEVLEALWWTADEYDDMMRGMEYIVFMMEAGEGPTVNDNVEHCTRGLELRTEAGKWARFEHKRDCYNAVLDEQDRQWDQGEDDNPQLIATACREVTAKTQRIACRRGLQDATDIDDFVRDTRQAWKVMQQELNGDRTKNHSSSSSPQSRRKNGLKAPARVPSSSSTDTTNIKSSPRMPQRVSSHTSDRRSSHGSVQDLEGTTVVATDLEDDDDDDDDDDLSDQEPNTNDPKSAAGPKMPQRTASNTTTNKNNTSDRLRLPVRYPSHSSAGSVESTSSSHSNQQTTRAPPPRGSSGKPNRASESNNKMPRRTLSNKDNNDDHDDQEPNKGENQSETSNNKSPQRTTSKTDRSQRRLPRTLVQRSATMGSGSSSSTTKNTGERPKRATSLQSTAGKMPRRTPSGKLDPKSFAKFSGGNTTEENNNTASSSPTTTTTAQQRRSSKLNPTALAKFGG